MNSRVLAFLAAVVLAICVGAVWFLNQQSPTPAPALAQVVEAAPANPQKTVVRTIRNPPSPNTGSDTVPLPKEAPPLAEWERKIDQVLQTNADETQTAQMLINLLPTLPPDGQAEAAQHITNLITDKDYARVLPLTKNPSLPEEVLDVLVTDLMNREDDVKLPALLEIAKLPNHPHHEEAASDLEIFLDEDDGQDWGKWERTMKVYLKKQAEENAAAEKEDAAQPVPKTGAR